MERQKKRSRSWRLVAYSGKRFYRKQFLPTFASSDTKAARWRAAFAALAIISSLCVSAWGTQYLSFVSDNRAFIGPSNPYLETLNQFESNFASSKGTIIGIYSTNPNESIFTPSTLEAIANLTEDGWLVSFTTRVASVTNFSRTYPGVSEDGEDELVVEQLLESVDELSPQKANEIKGLALSDPLLVNNLISPTGDITAVVLSAITDLPDDAPVTIMKEVHELTAEYKARYPHLEFVFAGDMPGSDSLRTVAIGDLLILAPIALFAAYVALALSVRSFLMALVVFGQILAATIVAMGMAGWLGFALDPASVNATVMIAVLGLAHGVHFITSLQKALKRFDTQREAVDEAFRANVFPVFLSTISTIVGCLSMNWSDAPPFHTLGNITAIGLTVGFIFWCTVVPYTLRRVPLSRSTYKPLFGSFENHMGEFVIRYRTQILAFSPFLMILIGIGLFQLQLADNFVKEIGTRYEFRRHADLVSERLGGESAIEFVLDAGENNGAMEPEFLEEADKFAKFLESRPETSSVYSITEIIKRLNRDINKGDPAYYRLPASQEETGQYIFLYEMSLPHGTDLTDRIDIGRRLFRISARVWTGESNELRRFEDDVKQWAAENLPAKYSLELTGASVIYAHISTTNIRSMIGGTFFSLIFVSLMLIAVLRRPRVSAFSLLANVLPAVMALGIWGLVSGSIGMAVSVVVALTFGIVVDDTVHFLNRYLEASRKHGMSAEDAVRYTFDKVGRAIVVTSFILCFGFAFLVGSGYGVTKSFGALAAAIILAALAFDLLILPGILIWIDQRKSVANSPFVPAQVSSEDRSSPAEAYDSKGPSRAGGRDVQVEVERQYSRRANSSSKSNGAARPDDSATP